jgi:hypothetical protein
MRSAISAAALGPVLGIVLGAGAEAATTEFQFSFDNTLGPTPGTVTGTVALDFLASPTGSGTGSATSIVIDTISPGLEPSSVGTDAVGYDVVAVNSFTVTNGAITDFAFGSATAGGVPLFNLCLNNGAQFDIAGTLALCLEDEIGYGNSASQFTYNQGGAAGVTFTPLSQVPPPASVVLLIAGAGALAGLRATRTRPGS